MTVDTKALRGLLEKRHLPYKSAFPFSCGITGYSHVEMRSDNYREIWREHEITSAINAIPELLDVYDNLEKLIGGLREFAAKLSGLSPEQRRSAFEVSLPHFLKHWSQSNDPINGRS